MVTWTAPTPTLLTLPQAFLSYLSLPIITLNQYLPPRFAGVAPHSIPSVSQFAHRAGTRTACPGFAVSRSQPSSVVGGGATALLVVGVATAALRRMNPRARVRMTPAVFRKNSRPSMSKTECSGSRRFWRFHRNCAASDSAAKQTPPPPRNPGSCAAFLMTHTPRPRLSLGLVGDNEGSRQV